MKFQEELVALRASKDQFNDENTNFKAHLERLRVAQERILDEKLVELRAENVQLLGDLEVLPNEEKLQHQGKYNEQEAANAANADVTEQN